MAHFYHDGNHMSALWYMSHIFKLVRAKSDFLKITANFYEFFGRDSKYLSIPNLLVEVSDFAVFFLGCYLDPDSVPHHSSDVFFHGELISDQFTGVQALCAPIPGTSETRNCLESSKKYHLPLVPEPEICHSPRLGRAPSIGGPDVILGIILSLR